MDTAAVFNDDYLYFYAERLDRAHSDAETDLLCRVLGVEPGMRVLDLACGHGRIANRLAARGCEVTGLDATPLFLDLARRDAEEMGVSELNNRDALVRAFLPTTSVRRGDDLLVDRHGLDPLTGRIDTERLVVRGGAVRRTGYSVRLFTFTELREWLADAGFTGIDGYGDGGDRLTIDSRRMIVTARR